MDDLPNDDLLNDDLLDDDLLDEDEFTGFQVEAGRVDLFLPASASMLECLRRLTHDFLIKLKCDASSLRP